MGAAGREAKLLRRSPGLRMRRDCASETTGVSVSERTQEGLSGPATSASQQRPPPRRSRGRGILPHADLTWLRNRGGRACDVRANSGPRWRVTGVFRVRGCLPEASTIFQKLNRFFLLFFPRLLHSSLCFPVGCHHSLVNEKLGNFPEGHGENRWPRRKEQKQTLRLVGTQAVGKVPTPA